VLLEGGHGRIALEHDDPAVPVEVEVEAHDTAGTIDADQGRRARARNQTIAKLELRDILEPGDVRLRFAGAPRGFVIVVAVVDQDPVVQVVDHPGSRT
jgi:hypothetical protein